VISLAISLKILPLLILSINSAILGICGDLFAKTQTSIKWNFALLYQHIFG